MAVKSKLLKQYYEWQKTPYKMGGLSKRGIDCSGFAYITFRSKLGCNIPRTTKLQVKTGEQVARNNLRTGDLVFFQTSLLYNHVGIYLGDAKFLHASSSRGVIISSLTENYWKKRYWTARRISR
jgi:cell wall-associated NlpC family hydrolase